MKKNMKMRHLTLIACAAALLSVFSAQAKPISSRVIQPPYAPTPAGIPASFEWMMNQLQQCTPDLDLIVLPEFSDVPGRTKTRQEYLDAVDANNERLLKACAETAARCSAVLFVNAIDHTPEGIRNTTFAFDRAGKLVGKYYKRHVTAGERDDLGFDVSYARQWSEPDILEIDGIRYAFLTCYDFYFYEMIGPIALKEPDIVIGCSLQRSDKHHALEFINQFCAYNTGAYLVRASVSMGEDSTVGGSSMVVAPTGIILGNMRSRTGALDITFDPSEKYLKPAGFGNPLATHPSYMEIGRRPWLYRPGGSAICLPVAEAPAQRVCALGGMYRIVRSSPMAAIGAAIAEDVDEIGLKLTLAPDGSIRCKSHKVGRSCNLDAVLHKFSCHTIFNFTLEGEGWNAEAVAKLASLLKAYDSLNHAYICSSSIETLRHVHDALPKMARCLEGSVVDATAEGCQMVMVTKHNRAAVKDAHKAGLRCVTHGSRFSKGRLFRKGFDTVIISDYR